MRVEVLKLGSSVGTETQQASILQSADAVLQSQVSALSNSQRIQQQAQSRGMTMPLPLDLHFLHVSGAGNVSKAIADVREPSPSDFLAGLQSERTHDGASVATAETTSAIGVLGGGAISDSSTGTSTPSGTGTPAVGGQTTTTTLTVAPPTTTGAATTAASDPSSTQTVPSTSADGGLGTGSSTPASTGATSSDGTSGAAGGADNVPPVTNTTSNGASGLAG